MKQKNYNVFDAIKDTVLHNDTCWAEENEVERRKEICSRCPDYTSMKTCRLCGCFIPMKTKYKQSSCPSGKW